MYKFRREIMFDDYHKVLKDIFDKFSGIKNLFE